jgi:hypothetical protein
VLVAMRNLRRRDGLAANSPAGADTAELEAQAARALVETDNAVKTSDQALGFAVARFGEHAAAPFTIALQSARAELAEAFNLRQRLDDQTPAPGPANRKSLAEISRRCAEANRLLDDQSAAFDRLQDLEARAPEVLFEVGHHVTQQSTRLDTSQRILEKLAARYTQEAVAIVASNPVQAGDRLEFAEACIDDARRALASDETGQAAVLLQAAELAADQAESLLDAIEHLEAELTQAASALRAALREIDVEIAEATAVLAGQADDSAAAVSRAEAAASAVRNQMQSRAPFDTLPAVRDLAEADAALDHALAGKRTERDRRDRAAAVLDQVMLAARSAITAAGDFITTRRGGIAATARTRLAEAQRHFREAIAFGQDNPEAAVGEALRADALARQARALAERDVTELADGQPGQLAESGFAGAVLGGILIDSQPDGERGVPAGGVRGDGAFRLGGSGTPASFGGVGTRGRHSLGDLV